LGYAGYEVAGVRRLPLRAQHPVPRVDTGQVVEESQVEVTRIAWRRKGTTCGEEELPDAQVVRLDDLGDAVNAFLALTAWEPGQGAGFSSETTDRAATLSWLPESGRDPSRSQLQDVARAR
jgi:hypothetical protein